jgi:hypothetical protein
MVLNGNGGLCASSVVLNLAATNCDGLGLIRSHALDPGGQRSFNQNDTVKALPAGLHPTPGPEGGTYSWNPVTKLYGCEVLSPCVLGTSNRDYIKRLKTALGGSSIPTSNYVSEPPYTDPLGNAFLPAPLACVDTAVDVVYEPGNWYVPCAIDITKGQSVIFKGGTVVVNGGLTIKAGCFVMNTTSCSPTLVNAGTSQVTTSPAPARDALLYLRGGSFEDSDRLVMPQTFVFQEAGSQPFRISATATTLWTAPGAGAATAGRTTLEDLCWVNTPAPPHADTECMNSRFSRMAYWNEYSWNGTNAASVQHQFSGQGQLNVVGVVFTPRAFLNLSGGGSYTAAAAQFWTRVLDISGNVPFVLSPDVKSPVGGVALIR